MKLAAGLAAVQKAPRIYLCPLIRVRRLGGCQLCPTGASVLTTCLSAAACVSAALYRPSQVWLYCFVFFLSSLHWRRTELQNTSSTLLWNQTLLCGWFLMALLPSHFCIQPLLITPMTTLPCHTCPFLAMPRNCKTTDVSFPTYHLFTGNQSSVTQRPAAGMFAVLPSIEKRIYRSISVSPDTCTISDCQVLLVSFLSSLAVTFKVCSWISTNLFVLHDL